MAGNEPAYLPVGTDVSAKYRGAFCEAKVKKLVRAVKCKVILKETQTSVIVSDDNLKGSLKVGATVEIKHPDTGQVMEGAVSKLTDQSMYTVVFDDGDEKTLRRTQLCLKGEKHFIESETLDNLPLSHPEHFGTPVLQNKSRKRTAKMGSPGFNTLYLAQEDTESEESSSEEFSPKRASYRGRQQELVGKVMFIEGGGDKRKGGINPVLVVLPDAASVDLKTKDHILVKSFRDGKFFSVLKKELKDFTRDVAIKNEDKTLKAAIEKALLYFDNHELPASWKRDELLGSDDEADIDDDDSSDDEPSEEKDRFVAQLYKFMDDRGTPINKGPSIGNRDLNLYKLFRVVQNLGGYNRVTNQMKWRLVYSKMGLPQSNTASHQIKNAYKKFLHAFEDFYRKLGSTMGTISRPGRSRHSSGRSILSFRGREKESPKSPRSVKSKDSDKEDSDRGKSRSDADSVSEDGKDTEEETCKEETPSGKEESERKERTTPRRMLRDDLKEAKEKEKEARKKKEEKEEVKKKDDREDAKSKKEDKEEIKSKKEEKEEARGKKEDRKMVEEERKSSRRDKQEDKLDSKKEEVKSDRETRGQKDKQKEESKEKEKPKKKEKEKEEEKEEQVKQEDEKGGKKQRITRRKSGRGDEGKKETEEKSVEETEEKKLEEKKTKKEESVKTKKDEKKEVKKEEKKDVKKEEKKEDKEKKEEKPKEKKTKEKKQTEEESEEKEDEESEEITLRPREEFPTGTKLKVRYGRGRNQKIYEAKVVEANKDGSHKTYLVHYAGWNNRYDEWVKADRIIAVVNKPDVAKLSQKKNVSPKTTSPKQVPTLQKKRGRPPVGQQTPSPGASAEFRTPPPKSRSPAPGSGQNTKTRPTRSNSLENQVVEGLPPKRLTRRSSGITESSDTMSHASDESSDSDSDETEQKIVVVVEEHNFAKDGDESDVKESEHDTSMEEEEEVQEEEHDTSIDEKDTDISREGEGEIVPPEDDSLLQCNEELMKSEEEDVDVSEEKMVEPEPVPQPETIEEKVEEVSVTELKDDKILVEEPKRESEKKEIIGDSIVEKDAAPELVAEKPFKEIVTKHLDGKMDCAAANARFEASEALLQMPILHEAFVNIPEEQKESLPERKKQENPPMPEIKKIESEIPKKEKEVEKKERGRKPRKDVKEGKKMKATEPVVLEPKPVEPHVMTPQEARKKAAMDLYDFQGDCDEPEEELVLRRDKKTDLLGSRRFLTLEKEMKPDILESGETEKKKVKKKVKKKGGSEEEGKKEFEGREMVSESKKEVEKKDMDTKKDSVKESAKGKGVKGEKCAKKETKKTKDTKSESDIVEICKEKKEKRPRSRSASPVETCSKILKTEPASASPKPSTSAEPVPSMADQPPKADSLAEMGMNTMLDNTPPTTPEHEATEAESVAIPHVPEGQVSVKDTPVGELTDKLRSESPSVGEGSGSSCEGNENNSALPTSESSNDVEMSTAVVGKRKRDSQDQTPSKKKKRISKGGKAAAAEKKSKTVQGSDSDEGNNWKHPSPVHNPGPSSPMKMPESAQVTAPRPPKYNFNLEEGNYLEGEKRITFLIDKMQEIRKIYMNLKQEVACIDRRRKRAKRKERDNSQSSHVDCESS